MKSNNFILQMFIKQLLSKGYFENHMLIDNNDYHDTGV